jgi:hypothetical protein
MKPKVGSPEARAIVAMLIRRRRKAWQRIIKEQDSVTSNLLTMFHLSYYEINNATEVARRILYGQDK